LSSALFQATIRLLGGMSASGTDVSPKTVVPGHNDIGGPQLLADVRDYLELLRDETWVRRDSATSKRSAHS